MDFDKAEKRLDRIGFFCLGLIVCTVLHLIFTNYWEEGPKGDAASFGAKVTTEVHVIPGPFDDIKIRNAGIDTTHILPDTTNEWQQVVGSTKVSVMTLTARDDKGNAQGLKVDKDGNVLANCVR